MEDQSPRIQKTKPSISIPVNEIHATVELTPTTLDTHSEMHSDSPSILKLQTVPTYNLESQHTRRSSSSLQSSTNSNGQQRVDDVDVATSSTSVVDENSFIADFAKILQRMDLVDEATDMYKILQKSLMDIDLKKGRQLAICVLFLSARQRSGDTMSIRHIIEKDETRVILAEFYDLLSSSISVLGLDDTNLAKEVKLAQKKLILCDCLFEKFNNIFHRSFNNIDSIHQFMWIFFFILNVESNLRVLDFEEQYLRLQATIQFIWNIAPEEVKTSLSPSFTNNFGMKIPENTRNLPESILRKILEKDVFVLGEDKSAKVDIFSHLSENVEKASQYYEEIIDSKQSPFDFDGRLFITNRKLVGPSDKIKTSSVVQMNLHDYSTTDQREIILFSPSNQTPTENLGRSISPLHATLHSITILTKNLADESDEPDEVLQKYFASCDTDLTNDIISKLNSKMKVVTLDDSMTQERREYRHSMIRKLFYKSLRITLIGEEKRRNTKNFTALLQNERFLTSLLMCSIESILFGYNMKHWIQFSDLLKALDLKPFDFVKMIESFVLNTSSWLSSPFKRHFRRVEEMCIDSLGWTPDAPIFSQANQISQMASMPRSNAPETPARKKHDRVYEVFTNKDQKLSPSLNFFLNKVNNLLALRIRGLCALFNETSEELMQKIWSIVHYVLTNDRSMMIGRHLDQLIICSLYIVFNKIAKTSVTFKVILVNYRRICEENRNMSTVEILRVLNHIPISGDTYGDIVLFYNRIFIPSVKEYIFQLCRRDPTASSGDSDVPLMPDIASPQRTRISRSKNVFLSPLRKSPKPGSKPLYSFGDHHTQKHADDGNQMILPTSSIVTPDKKQKVLKRKLFESSSSQSEGRKNKRQATGENEEPIRNLAATEALSQLSNHRTNENAET